MLYHLNFGLIWRHFDKLGWGLILSLELALVAIGIGIVIGLAFALLFEWGGRTVFVLEDGEYPVFPKPKTAVCFPADVAHFSDDVSRKFTGLRVTVAYKLSAAR